MSKVISIRQPWAWMILHAGNDMANMDDIIKRQQDESAKGLAGMRAERDAFRMTLRDQFAMSALPAVMARYQKNGYT